MPGYGQGISAEAAVAIIGPKLNGRPNSKGGYDQCDCPVHGGHDNLSVDVGDNGGLLVHCFSGCDQKDVMDAIRERGLPLPEKDQRGLSPGIRAARKARDDREATKKKTQLARLATLYDPLTRPTPYLARKGFDGETLARLADASAARRDGNRLIVPLVNEVGELVTIQTIHPDGKKILLKDCTKKGSFHPIGIRPEEIANLRLPNYLGEENPAFRATLCLAEGWATAAAIWLSTGRPTVMCVDAGNMPEAARIMRRLAPDADIILCADEDRAGIGAATRAALAVGGKVARPRSGVEAAAKRKGYDFWGLWSEAGPEAVFRAIEAAAEPEVAPTPPPAQDESSAFERELERLAGLSALEYERQRQDAAKRFGVQATRLDRLVKERKGKEPEAGQAAALPFEETEPWPEPVDGAELLDEIEAAIGRFIICDPPVLTAAALWAAFTWFTDVVNVAPIALITAPEKACGKTQLLEVFARLARRSMQTSNISPAALFRAIEMWRPSLMMDEADTFMRDKKGENQELRGVINSGHTRASAYVIRTVGEEHVPAKFSTWGAKAIAGIKADGLADTITDRAVVFRLRKKLKTERVERLRGAEARELFPLLRRKLARFAQDAAEVVERADAPELEALSDRQMDNWSPLLAVALAAGGTWLERAQGAALALSGVEDEPGGIGPELLANVRDVFRDHGDPDRIATADLIEALCANEEWRWATYNHGREVAPRQVASLLKGYGIKTNNKIRIGDRVARGYMKADFEDAFMRYV